MTPLTIDRKTWRKMDLLEQQYLTRYYEVILDNYWINPVKANLDKITPHITIKNTQKGIKMVSGGIAKFSKAMDEFKIFPDNGNGVQGIISKQIKHTDLSGLIGKKKKEFRI